MRNWQQRVLTHSRQQVARRAQLVHLAYAASPKLTVALAAAVLLSGSLSTAFILVTANLIGAVPGGGQQLTNALIVASATFLASQLIETVRGLIGPTVMRRLDASTQAMVMEAVLRPPGIAHLEDPEILDLMRQAQNVGSEFYTPGRAILGLAEIAVRWLRIAGQAIAIGALFSWPLATLLTAAAWFGRAVQVRQFLRMVKLSAGRTADLRRALYHRDLVLAPAAAKEVRLFGLTTWIADRFRSAMNAGLEQIRRERSRGQLTAQPSMLPSIAISLATLYLVASAAAQGRIGLGALAVLIQAAAGLAASGVSHHDHWLAFGSEAQPAMDGLMQNTQTDPPTSSKGRRAFETQRDDGPSPPSNAIKFEHVAFAYPRAGRNIYTDLNLTIPANRSLAIVGRNGAGKTTLIKLLTGLHQPTRGRISVDGADLSQIDPDAWRRQVAAIFQDFVRFELPVADNIGFGALEHAQDMTALRDAARQAGALELIEQLQRGWSTPLSNRFAGGTDLSGGQWQRVALARALFGVRAGARVLILDEPTASLDVRAEAEIFDRFLEITRGLTTILITHRLASVRHADRICLLEEGEIKEGGTHDQLMAEDGHYAHMFRLQAARFGDEHDLDPERGDDS